MGVISAGDQILLRDRKDNQQSIERLYGFGFPEMWRGQVDDGTIARGDQTITYDMGVLQGTFVFANLVTDLLLFIGSSAGADDKGRRRILSISGVEATGTIIVDWNDDIDWQDDDHLTIVHFFPPWARYSWFTATGPDFRKDGPPSGSGGAGVDYTDQNEEPPPLVIMGPHFAGELSAGTLAVQLSAANSQAVADGAAISSFAWAAVPTASASFDNAAIAAPVVTFTADNTKYWIACTVTDDNGKSSIGYRSYQIGGAITEFSRGPITENYDNPSVSATLTLTSPETTDSDAIRPVMTWADFADRTLVVITSEDQYGATQKTITFRDAAQYEDHNHILYVGYLFAENDDLIDDGSGSVTLNAVSTIPMFLYSISLTGVENATDWFEMNKELMTVAANLFHLFKYQSTLLEIMDWHLPFTDTVLRSANEEFNEGSLIDRARALAGARLMAITAVGLGEVWVETDLNLRNSADRTAETTTLTMTDSDVSGTKRARVRQYGDNIRAILDGGSSIGLLGSFTPFLSASTFIATAEGRPQMVNFPRLMLPDQTEANRLAGRIATVANGKFQETNLELSGNYRAVFSPGDQQKVDLGDIFAGSLQANIRGYTDLEDADVIVRTMTHNHNNGFTSVSIVADIMQDEGLTGVTITPPAVPPDAIEPGAGGDTPTFELPPPPAFPPVPTSETTGTLFSFDDTQGCYYRLEGATDWTERNGGLAGADIADQQGGFDPWWQTAFKANSSNPEQSILWKLDVGKIFRSTDGGTTWDDLSPFIDDPPNTWSDAPAPTLADVTFVCRTDNIHANQEHYFLGNASLGGLERSWLLKTSDDGITWTWGEFDSMVNATPSSTISTTTINGVDDFETLVSNSLSVGNWYALDGNNGPITFGAGGRLTNAFSVKETNTNPGEGLIGTNLFTSVVNLNPPPWATTTLAHQIDSNYSRLIWKAHQTDIYAKFQDSAYGDNAGTLDLILKNITGISAAGLPTELQSIWMDTDSEDGSTLWITIWADTFILLQKRDTATLTLQDEFAMSKETTLSQLNAKTFIAYPRTPAFDKDVVYIYGRMNAPQGLANPEHIIETLDGGSSFTSIENGFAADYVGALAAAANGANWDLELVRNVIAGSTGQFYSGLNTGAMALQGATTFQVNQDALTGKSVSGVDTIAIGAILVVSGEMVNISIDGGATWSDITDSLPATDEIKSLVYI